MNIWEKDAKCPAGWAEERPWKGHLRGQPGEMQRGRHPPCLPGIRVQSEQMMYVSQGWRSSRWAQPSVHTWSRGGDLAGSLPKSGEAKPPLSLKALCPMAPREVGNLEVALSSDLAFPPTVLQLVVFSRKTSLRLKRNLDTLIKTTERRKEGTMINKRQTKKPLAKMYT